MELKEGTKVRLSVPKEIYIDYTEDREHMHAYEDIENCRPTALVGRYVLDKTYIPPHGGKKGVS